MSSTAGMELSILKLTSPRRRKIHSARFTFDNDLAPTYGTSNVMSPHGSSPSSPLWGGTNRVTVDDDMLTIFEPHRAAIPFKWEEIPGTCRDGVAAANRDGLKSVSESEQKIYSCLSSSSAVSRSSSGGTGRLMTQAQDEVDDDDDDDNHEAVVEDHTVKPHLDQIHPSSDSTAISKKNFGSDKHDTEVQSKGQSLPLKPPPGLQSIKQLLNFENDERSIINSSKPRARRSFRRGGLKALPFLSSSSPKRDHQRKGGLPCTVLGFEEWPKVVQEQEKQQQQQQEENQRDKEEEPHHRRATSVTRFSFSFRKKPTTEKGSSTGSIDFLDGDDDDIFNEDFGKKGGLMDRRPLTSLSSRNLTDGHRRFRNRSWVYDSDTDYSDGEADAKMDYFVTSHVIAEGDEKYEQQDTNSKDHSASTSVSTELPKEKRKKHHRNPLTRVLGLSSGGGSGKDHRPRKSHQKPSRLSAVSPAPPPPPPGAPAMVPVRSDLKQKTALHGASSASSNPLLKMCLSSPIGQALIKNVKHLRSFEFHTPRALTAK